MPVLRLLNVDICFLPFFALLSSSINTAKLSFGSTVQVFSPGRLQPPRYHDFHQPPNHPSLYKAAERSRDEQRARLVKLPRTDDDKEITSAIASINLASFRWDDCDKTFTRRTSLENHVRTHTVQRHSLVPLTAAKPSGPDTIA